MKQKVQKQRKKMKVSEELSRCFNVDELKATISSTKSKKSAYFDGIYPDFIKNLGSFALKWLTSLFNNRFISARLPLEFKKTKAIAILKNGKRPQEASSYRPISLQSVCYKIWEMIYLRISPLIEDILPSEQSRFRPQRSCCDQILAFTSNIESGFEKRLKSDVVLLDLTAAYDTV
ncbi:putative RNA-directed DNA polymerase from transposon BS-like Protein [Tribolium castaneum]|uniref:Putative RNA-directed DNA polymerase from transposon BS-like Protein n=1 Tax=Tribolium castaneum TaxID=7070 RepID=D7EL44_TRICA|nr:putative RNA-directed DNA polymerase from transposon BS-like Protein [Tribolium castaneum]